MTRVPHPILEPVPKTQQLALGLSHFVIICGCLVSIGWWLRMDTLVQFRPSLDPVKANAAIALALLGFALRALLLSPGRYSWLGLLPASIGLSSVLQDLLGINLGIDELLVRDYLSAPGIANPGRMAPAAAVCLFLTGLVLTPLLGRGTARRALGLGLAGSLAAAIGTAAILGYLLNLPGGLGWNAGGSLSPFSGSLAILLGVALLVAAWRVHENTDDTPPVWMPLPVIVASCALTLILYTGLRERERYYAAVTSKNTLDSLGSAIHLEIERQSAALERIARRWSLLESASPVVREADAVNYLNEAPGARALAWTSAEGLNRWLYPLSGNEALDHFDHTRDPLRNDAILRARSISLPAVSATLQIPGLGQGFAIYAPILTVNGSAGFATADYAYPRFFAALDTRLKRSTEGYDYIIEIGGVNVFDSRDPLLREAALPNALESIFPIFERRVRITLAPVPDSDTLNRRRLPEVALFTGFGITLLLGLSVHFARVARAGQRQTENTNDKLRAEVEDRRQAEAALRASQLAERKLGLVAARTDNLVIIARPDGAIEWVNDAFTRLLERTLAEVGGHPALDLLGQSDPAASMRLRQALDAGDSLSTDLSCRSRSGRQYDLSLDLQPIYGTDGRLENYIFLAADITQRVETERELRRAKIEADAASRAKSDFLASMSHEIRTPMNGVIGMTSLLLHSQLSPDQRDSVNTIRQSGETLLTIINDILDFSKIESGQLELEALPFDLGSLAEETLDLFAPLAAARSLDLAYRIDPTLPPWIEGDPTRLRQILANLVNNAIKFTPSGSVSLEIIPVAPPPSARPTHGGNAPRSIEFLIRDTGIGIAPDRVDRLFKAFSQVDSSTTRKYGGTGLGLVICQRLTQLMGGQIEVDSEVGRGSTFRFSLPLRSAPTPAESLPLLPPAHRPAVLLLETHPLNRRRLVEQISAQFGPVIAPSDPAALETLLSGAATLVPTLIVADAAYFFPDPNHSLAARLRTLHLPVLWLHPPGHPSTNEFPLGPVHAHLTRPARTAQVISALRRHLGVDAPRTSSRPPLEIEQLSRSIPLSILLVEDNLVNQKVALRFLDRLGYRADAVANGLEAVRSVQDRPYDLVFMDLQMPEMDGFEASREIRHSVPTDRQPRIIALTANALQGDREACLAAGMDDYITKPIKLQDIAASIQRQFAPPTS